MKKKNTFTDFIDCGKYLIQDGYADPERIFALGGSAGGLLIGAVVNMSPDLFTGLVAAVPFVDVIAATDSRRDLMASYVHLTPAANRIAAEAFADEVWSQTCDKQIISRESYDPKSRLQ